MRVVTPTQPESAPLAEVAAIRDSSEQAAYERLLHPGLTELWAGFFDLGLALTRGNARTSTFTTSLTAARKTRTDNTRVYFNQIYSTATADRISANTAQAVRGGIAYDRNLGSRVFVNLFNDYEYDKFQNLDLRFVLGSGLGQHLLNSEGTKLDALGGIAYNRESFSSTPAAPAFIRKTAEGYFGDQLAYKLNGKTSLSQSFRLFTSVQDAGQYRINFDVSTSTTLKKWLSLQITASDRYLNVPAVGRQKNDILLTTGFRVTFAR
jgi:putative salt-induced outer membrane protein YdiY